MESSPQTNKMTLSTFYQLKLLDPNVDSLRIKVFTADNKWHLLPPLLSAVETHGDYVIADMAVNGKDLEVILSDEVCDVRRRAE